MALFAEAKRALLRVFLRLPNDLLSHDTFRFLSRNLDLCSLDPDQFRASFQRFMSQFSEQLPGGVAVNGRGLRRSFDRASGGSAAHTINARGCERRPVLTQTATDAKSNEITAVPILRMNI